MREKIELRSVLYTADVPDKFGNIMDEATLIKMAESDEKMEYDKNLKQLFVRKKVSKDIMKKLAHRPSYRL